MTILPKRKRRVEQRDQESGQNINVQTNSSSLLDVQQTAGRHHSSHSTAGSSHSSTGQKIDSTHGLGHGLGHGHPHRSAYNTMLFNHLTDNPAAVLGVDSKWRRSPPSSRTPVPSTSEEQYPPLVKKSKRSRVKQKHSNSCYDLQMSDNHHLHPLSLQQKQAKQQGDNLNLLSVATPGSGPVYAYPAAAHQSRQLLIPTVKKGNFSQHSPKMPGGAQQKSGQPQRPCSSGSDIDDEKNPPSPGGCNSEDEHVPSLQEGHTEELEVTFELALKKELGLEIKQMEMDGSCLFRAIADQVYGDQNMHDVVREHCINYMAKNSDHFSHYVTEDFTTYLQRKRQLGCHGNHIEMQALSEMYSRPIEVYQYAIKPMNIFHGSYRPESAFPIRVSYHRNTHYNSLIDPEKPTIGVGLGLSDFKPRMVEKNLVAEVKSSSENYHIEQTMLKDKLRETDWEITDEAINEQVARESYSQWLQDCQKQKRRAPSCTVTGPSCSSGASNEEAINWVEKLSPTGSPRHSSPNHDREKSGSSKASSSKKAGVSSNAEGASSSAAQVEDAEAKPFFVFEPFTVYNYNDNVDEGEALARAIAESQQEYIHQVLKK